MNVKAHLFLAAAALFAAAAPAATPSAPQTITSKVVLDSGSVVSLSAPAAAVGPDHNIHIVAYGSPSGSTVDRCKIGGHACNIYYLLVSPSGTRLISTTKINNSGAGIHGHPAVAVTSTGQAVIVWGGKNETLRYALVDPSKQGSLDGSALKPVALVKQETAVGNSTGGKFAFVLDPKNIAYVVKLDGTGSEQPLDFLKFNPATGDVLQPEAHIGSDMAQDLNFPSMAIDSKGNLHVVYGAVDLDEHGAPAGYTMLDPNGNILIGTTQLFNSELHPHVQKQHLMVAVDSNDMVHVVYGDKRNTPDANTSLTSDNFCHVCATGGTSVYTRLDPTKVPHNSEPADITKLRVGSELEIPGFWYGRAFMGGDKLIHLIAGVGKTGSMAHVAFDPRYGAIALNPVIHTGTTLNGSDYGPKFVAGAGNQVVWAESPPDGRTLRLVMAPVSAFY